MRDGNHEVNILVIVDEAVVSLPMRDGNKVPVSNPKCPERRLLAYL